MNKIKKIATIAMIIVGVYFTSMIIFGSILIALGYEAPPQ